jgi:glycosyltransferase involved in cell wall biosynthesis
MKDTGFYTNTHSLSVVIATLGGDSLATTIDALNRGSIVPNEILICIPENEAIKVKELIYPNVKIIVTECRGQVAQRVIGFRSASHDWVMQLDDDMLVDEHCIQHLLDTFKILGTNVAVAPALMNSETGESVYKRSVRNRTLQKLYYWLMNGSDGYQPGKLDKAGTAVGFDSTGARNEIFNAEWLAGGCVMHHRDNLVLENFYPFAGKAYFEDVIHSYHLRCRGISLKVASGARCWLDLLPVLNFGPMTYLKHLVADYGARKYAMRLYSKNYLRIYIFYIVNYVGFVYKKIVSNF